MPWKELKPMDLKVMFVGLGTEVILVAFLGLMHFRVALAILVFG